MNRITSLANPLVKELLEIKRDQTKASSVYFLVEGHHMVDMAIKSGLIEDIYSIEHQGDLDCVLVNDAIIKKISSTVSPQGVVAKCKKDLGEVISSNIVFYLDGVQDPGNVGSIMRTMLAFGFYDLILSPDCASIYNSKTLLASQGANFSIRTKVLSNESLIDWAKDNKYAIVTTELSDSAKLLEEVDFGSKTVLIFGSEGSGVSPLLRANKDMAIYIPIENIDSLNVGVAFGIISASISKKC